MWPPNFALLGALLGACAGIIAWRRAARATMRSGPVPGYNFIDGQQLTLPITSLEAALPSQWRIDSLETLDAPERARALFTLSHAGPPPELDALEGPLRAWMTECAERIQAPLIRCELRSRDDDQLAHTHALLAADGRGWSGLEALTWTLNRAGQSRASD